MTAIDTLRSGIARTAERLTEDARSRNGAAFVIAGVLGLLAPVLVGGYTLDLVMQLIILILVVTSWIFIAGYFECSASHTPPSTGSVRTRRSC